MCVQVALSAADPIEVHVAPAGDDAADGSRARPVGSLIGARDAVRRLRAAGRSGPVRVVVADGTYRFAEPLVLTPEDGGSAEAPVRYEAAPGAKPVFSGGRKITGFRPGENGLWVADMPGVAAGQWYFEQLWAGGRRAQRAKVPNTNWEEIARLPSPPGSRQRARDPDIDPFFFEEVVETDLDGGFKQHFGRYNTVRNNILAFSQQEQVRGTNQEKAGDHLSFTFERNIVYFNQGDLFGRPWQWAADVQVDLKNNIY
jgi:hypothetical protein